MCKKFAVCLTIVVLAFLVGACDLLKGSEPAPVAAPVPVAVPAPAPVPVVAPTPAPAAPPRTELVAIEQPAATVDVPGTGVKKPAADKGDNVDAPIAGPATEGDELLGNYTCAITSNDFPMGISPPPSGCRIFRAGDGSLKVGPTGGAGLKGNITDPKAAGFHIQGTYNLGPLGKFDLKARMARKGEGDFAGAGKGALNGNKEKEMKFKLTMTRM